MSTQLDQPELLVPLIEEVIHHACTGIAPDVRVLLEAAAKREENDTARSVLLTMLENARLAYEQDKPACQSPGFPCVYVTYGGKTRLPDLREVFGTAMRRCTEAGYLRPSMVHPLTRKNSGDNTGPGVPNFELDFRPELDYADFVVSFKACGAELVNGVKVFTAATLGPNLAGLKKYVLDLVIKGRGIPCPPVGIGIGIGGQIDVAARLSRRAISTREWTYAHPDPEIARLEEELLEAVNALGVGPGGTGGRTTALAVKIMMSYTHTAIAPVAVNFHCWVGRRAGVRIYEDGRVERLFWRGQHDCPHTS